MATSKSYTDINQSKKLAKFLPLESADMIYVMYSDGKKPQNGDANLSTVYESNEHKWYWIDIIDESCDIRNGVNIPAWSLAPLLGVIPNYQLQTQDDGIGIICSCNGNFNIVTANNAVDACVAMIEKLHELNLL